VVCVDDVLGFARELEERFGGVSSLVEDGMEVFRRGEKVFLVLYLKSDPVRMEVRTDRNLRKILMERYESVMDGRVLGRNGIEVIASGQLADEEVLDLIRLSYELTAEDK
jgi:predicted DNA-binding protein (MmcQ/YjbR family)